MISGLPQQLQDFVTLCERCETVQRDVLLDILHTNADTERGRRYGFSTIDDSERFRKTVKPTTWHDIAADAERLKHGEGDLLFPGKPPYFICTSGTTGNIKIVPESEPGRALKTLTARLRIEAIARHVPQMMQGKLLPLVNHAIEGYTEAGIPYGCASGIALATTSETIKKMVAFPMAVLDIDYCDTMDYLLMRFAVAEDVRAIFGNNAGRIAQLIHLAETKADLLIDDIENGTLQKIETLPKAVREQLEDIMQPDPERADALRRAQKACNGFNPAAYWPNLQVVVCWLSGSVGRYVETVRPLLSQSVQLFDVGYGATEGKFNIPLEPGRAAGPLAIHAGFYEFKELGTDNFLMAHEVQKGKSYELYVTTYSGLYRYAMDDIVRVEDFIGTTPEIVFEQKSGDMLNLCGEKVPASSLMPLVKKVVEAVTGSPLHHWCVVPDDNAKCYQFCIELSDEPENSRTAAPAIADNLEKIIQSETLIYPIFRKQKLLAPLRVRLMNRGWQAALYEERTQNGHSRAQVKLPLVYTEIPAPQFISDSLLEGA